MSPRRTLWTDLRAIDQAIVPRLAAFYASVRRGTSAVRASVNGGRGGPAATLRRLDQRFARRGMLGLVRDVPQLGIVVIALMLTIAGITTASRLNTNHAEATSPGVDLPAVTNGIAPVGPLPNEPIPEYVASAQSALAQQAAQTPREKTYAIVDFESGRTPSEVADALPGVEPQLIYLRVRVTGARLLFPNSTDELAGYPELKSPLRVTALPDDALSAYRSVANGLRHAGADLAQQAKTITADQDQTQKLAEEADARHYTAATSALRSSCSCIYAVVVFGTPQTLLHILDSGQVRAIDPAAPGLKLSEINWTPLLPETKSRQPAATTGP